MRLRTARTPKPVRERLVAVRFTTEELDHLRKVAEEQDTTVSALVRRGLIEVGAVPTKDPQ